MDAEPDAEPEDELDEFTTSLSPELRAQEEYLRAQVARHETETEQRR
jgi:hypothetical protein